MSTAHDEETGLATIDPRRQGNGALARVDSERAIAEVKAAIFLAREFPRDPVKSLDRIQQAFTRPTLAEKALYQYARGGQDITGPSIRCAEAIAQNWGNMQFGVRELDQQIGKSTVESFAWDMETNTRDVRTFEVRHERHTKKGLVQLTDPRDIYELIANQGARRKRACILAIIPGDVVEAAVVQAEQTLHTRTKVTPELIAKFLANFEALGVGKEAIEKWGQRRIDAFTPALFVRLGKIHTSIKDGMSQPEEWFELAPEPPAEEKPLAAAGRKTRAAQVLEKIAPKAPAEEPEPRDEKAEPRSDGQKGMYFSLCAELGYDDARRHGVNELIVGKKSSNDFTKDEMSRVVSELNRRLDMKNAPKETS